MRPLPNCYKSKNGRMKNKYSVALSLPFYKVPTRGLYIDQERHIPGIEKVPTISAQSAVHTLLHRERDDVVLLCSR